VIYCEEPLYGHLAGLGEELRFVLITSAARVLPLNEAPAGTGTEQLDSGATIAVTVQPYDAPKCSRCWHRCEDVGSHSAHPELCGRCVSNVDGDGEQREYA